MEAAPSKFIEPDSKRPRLDPTHIVLYSYWRSSCSYRVRIALNHKHLSYEYKAVHLLKDGGEQLKDEYATLNPSKALPTLVIDGHVLAQSTAILEYLEETRPETPLLPKDPFTRAIVRQMCNVVSNDIQPIANLRVLKHIQTFFTDAAAKDKARNEWSQHYIKVGFEALEKLLEVHAGKYAVGDSITLADVYLVPQVYNALRFKIDMSVFPTIQRVYDNVKDLPAFADAHPSKQPDAEE